MKSETLNSLFYKRNQLLRKMSAARKSEIYAEGLAHKIKFKDRQKELERRLLHLDQEIAFRKAADSVAYDEDAQLDMEHLFNISKF